jgi:DUF4097 and DUF4098 domain-containing protein YvlB
MTQEVLEKSFPVIAPGNLILSNIRGSVAISPGENDQISVIAVKHLNTGDPDQTAIKINQNKDGTVVVKTSFHKNSLLQLIPENWKPCKVDYRLQVPLQCSIHLSCVSSTASLAGIDGEFEFRMVSGDLAVHDLRGDFTINAVSGDVSGKNLIGPVDLKIVSGNANLKESQFPSIYAATVSGELVLQTAIESGNYRIKTVSGNANLILPAETALSLRKKTMSGRLHTNLPITAQEGSRQHSLIEIQGGGSEILFESLSGDIRITSLERPNIQEKDGKAANKETMEILESIASGELTVEEGINQLA